MPQQFFHISGYGRTPRPGEPRHATAVGILGEAVRRPSSSTHIPCPRPPRLLRGDGPETIFTRLEEIEARARDSAGRRLRSDAARIMVAVVSYPVPVAHLDEPNQTRLYRAWRNQVLGWLERTFGPALVSVLEHVDEAYPHLHAVLVPAILADGQLDWSCHPGRAAKAASARRGDTLGTQDACYRRAMAKLQDDLHRAVSTPFGHDRCGPRRARRERHHHLELKAANERIAILEDQTRLMAQRLAALSPGAGTGIMGAAINDDIPVQGVSEEVAPAAAETLHAHAEHHDDRDPLTISDDADPSIEESSGYLEEGWGIEPPDQPVEQVDSEADADDDPDWENLWDDETDEPRWDASDDVDWDDGGEGWDEGTAFDD